MLLGLVCEIALLNGDNGRDTEAHPVFVGPGYIIWVYIPVMTDTDLLRERTEEVVENGINIHRVFPTNSTGAFGEKKNRFILHSSGRKEDGSL